MGSGQYRRFADGRARPFFDLVARIGADAPRSVVDLGCGPGDLTVELARRWPGAAVPGMRRAFPPRAHGTMLPFRRVFVVAQRPG